MSTEWTKPMEWQAEGSEPSDALKTEGFKSGYKPPADTFNFFLNRTFKAIDELQKNATENTEMIAGAEEVVGNHSKIIASNRDRITTIETSLKFIDKSSADANGYLSSGRYFLINATNTPTSHGFLTVDYFDGTNFAPSGKGAEPITKQTWRAYSTNEEWKRTFHHNPNASYFTAWEKVSLSGHSHSNATESAAGFMSAADKAYISKLAKCIAANYLADGTDFTTSNPPSATGTGSVAINLDTIARGICSFAAGGGTIAESYETAVGKYNNPAKTTDGYDNLFYVGNGTSDSARSNAFRTTTQGKSYGLSSFSASNADFAELFEYADGNTDNEDRRGLIVTLDGEKIRLAKSGDNILGIISGTSSFVGDAASEEWHDRYLRDIFGEKIAEWIDIPEMVDDKGNIVIPAHKEKRWKLNPDYNPDKEYIPRENRPEWGTVGLLGKVVAVDDGSCKVGEYCTAGENGIATYSAEKTKIYCMKRIDDTHIKVFVGA